MVLSINKISFTTLFFISGLMLLLSGMCWGIVGALQYIAPGFLKQHLSFERVRPLHVSSVVFWIILGAIGGVLTYLRHHLGEKLQAQKLVYIKWGLFITTILAILISYAFGKFGGREYWEFHPAFALPIIVAWALFIIVFFKSLRTLKNQPVYVWMWLTGVVFFFFTFLESYLWLIPYFRNNVVNDMTIQWKSYGSMVGAWNMLIYGSSIFLMDKISGSKKYSYSKIAFGIYFLGLFNLMFNWGHHIYTLPTHGYIKHISYAVSMTELLLLGRIIYLWKSSLDTATKLFHNPGFRFFVAADAWIFLTLLLAIAMSIPAINIYTHGTHITVAHTMGATIGINSFLILAFVFDSLISFRKPFASYERSFTIGYWLTNISLLVFWLSLIVAGVYRSVWQLDPGKIPFSTMMQNTRPFFMLFMVTGITMFIGMLMVTVPLIKAKVFDFKHRKNRKEMLKIPSQCFQKNTSV